MKWLMIILTVFMMGCFEDESVTKCGDGEVFNNTIGVCVFDACDYSGFEECTEGCRTNNRINYNGENYKITECVFKGDKY